jgi:hypothetical protein
VGLFDLNRVKAEPVVAAAGVQTWALASRLAGRGDNAVAKGPTAPREEWRRKRSKLRWRPG